MKDRYLQTEFDDTIRIWDRKKGRNVIKFLPDVNVDDGGEITYDVTEVRRLATITCAALNAMEKE